MSWSDDKELSSKEDAIGKNSLKKKKLAMHVCAKVELCVDYKLMKNIVAINFIRLRLVRDYKVEKSDTSF